jgi:hypothetical protein
MNAPRRFRVKWDRESLEIERLDCKNDPASFEILVNYVLSRLTARTTSEQELAKLARPNELRRFIREAVETYNPNRHGNLAWYALQRMRFLVGKWRLKRP